ncbi:glycosyltransferase family 2 protein [Oryzomonas japonica]|uniref:Glycosyltransferase family 2 protein n=1 Tax=Oryzomonas japonica TaxID=2603858 RepID=A0A7J4ZPS6_9BACT|nr:glycosyltransferase family 2 protein [Oryzomonas japonica]KAB0664865.1 glycosyltransferase family 2 protein [Oryzomonas japonica]
MKITIGITVFNRLDYIRKMCLSLRHSIGLEQCSIRIYDDCSDAFGVDEIKKEFPFVTEFRRRRRNLGSDLNIQQMYLDFLETGDDVLINCDSDMIFHGEWLTKIRELLPFTDGVLSCYNSTLHIPVEDFVIENEKMVRKDSIGSAGTVFTRDIVQCIVNNVKPSYKYDWDWSRYLSSKGVRLFVTERSYIQHIGIVGQNCDASRIIDYGLNFFPSNEDTLMLNVAFFEQVIRAMQEAVEQKNHYYYFKYQVPKYKILQWIIEPLSLLKKRFKYGAINK